MTIANSYSPTRLSISGYDYDFTFDVSAETELLVYTLDAEDNPTPLTYGTDYIVTLNEVDAGGTVQTGSYVLGVWTPAEPDDEEILILRNTPLQQTANIPVRGGFRESVIEGGLDNLEKQIQELNYKYDLINDADPTAISNTIVAAQAAQAAAEAAQEAAETAQAGAEAAAETVVDEALDSTTGHRHDGADSRSVLATDLDVTGVTDGHYLKRSGSAIIGAEVIVSAFDIVTSNGNWTCPSGITKVFLTMIGGGGGGGGNGGGGGSSGAAIINKPYTVVPDSSYAVVIGAGGTAGAGGASGAGGAGGSTTFDSSVTASGGNGGTGGASGAGGANPCVLTAGQAIAAAGIAAVGAAGNGSGGGAGASSIFSAGTAGVTGGSNASNAADNSGAGAGGGGGSGGNGGVGGSGVCIIAY